MTIINEKERTVRRTTPEYDARCVEAGLEVGYASAIGLTEDELIGLSVRMELDYELNII